MSLASPWQAPDSSPFEFTIAEPASRSPQVERLRFRRQFLFVPQATEVRTLDWPCQEFAGYKLYTHPDLACNIAKSAHQTVGLALAGFIVDPAEPQASNRDLLARIADQVETIEDLFSALHRLSGRFALFAHIGGRLYAFHDACGLRTVFYTESPAGLLVGSSTEVLKTAAPLTRGEQYRVYLESSYVRNRKEHFLPAGLTLYDGVHLLTPNHYLELAEARQIRYWPDRKIHSRDPASVVEETSAMLDGSLRAAHQRYPLALSMTAGWDSRLLLALSRDFSREIYYYTLKYRSLNEKSHDIAIPRDLLRRLGLTHTVIDCSVPASSDFAAVYETNTCPAHLDDWGHIAYGMLNGFPQERIAVKGNVSEVARCFYYPSGVHPKDVSAESLLALEPGWADSALMREHVQRWWADASGPCAAAELRPLDLFYWEHRMGGWQAQSQLEWDIAQEVFTPYNNRRLLETMLSAPVAERSAPDYGLYVQLIQRHWPEVLALPINPPSLKKRIRQLLSRLAR